MDRNDKEVQEYEKPRVADYGDLTQLTATNNQSLNTDVAVLGAPPPNLGTIS